MAENNFGAVANFKREIVSGARECANAGSPGAKGEMKGINNFGSVCVHSGST